MTSVRLALQQLEAATQYISAVLSSKYSSRQLVLRYGLAGAAAYILTKFVVYRLWIHPSTRLPGPPVDWIPFLGNMREIIRDEPGDPQRRWVKKYGKLVGYHGPWYSNRVLVADPVLLKQILTMEEYDFIKSPDTARFLRPVLGDGILLAEGAAHRHQRKMLNPAFSVQATRGLVPVMAVPAVHLCRRWISELSADGPTEIKVSMGLSMATLDVIGMAGFGQEFRSVLDHDKPEALHTLGGQLSHAYRDIFYGPVSLMRMLSLFVPPLRELPITKRNRELKRDLDMLRHTTSQLVQLARKRLQTQEKMSPVSRDLLTLMIHQVDEETGKGMTDRELEDQCLTFLAAGHETTSVSLSWTLWLLAKHPEIQDALREEVKPLFGTINTDHPIFANFLDAVNQSSVEECVKAANIPSHDAINGLKLLNNICKESMRLYPPVPMTSRWTLKSESVLGTVALPRGTRLFVSPMVLHHDPDIWGEDVEVFRPDRWNEAPANTVSPYVYMPFLAGGRQCIGNRFAMMEMKVLLAILVSTFRFHEKPGFEPKRRQMVTLRPVPYMTLMVEKL